MSTYHIPVMAKECLEGLAIDPDGIYVDATFGGGGHSKLILEQLGDEGHLIGFDQDEDASGNVLDHEQFTFIQSNFRYLQRYLKLYAVEQVDGILADLGVSSHQFDEASRGFSYRFESALDMRMNTQSEATAASVINSASTAELQEIFSKYGEVRNARMLANAIVDQRAAYPVKTIGEFLHIIEPLVRGQRAKYLAQVFQALRIVVNDEMKALEELLEQSLALLKPGGRMVIMSYHSIEDRCVKLFFKTGNPEGKVVKDFYGNINRPFKIITKKAVTPSEEEIKQNPRARSAKLRIAEKI